MTWQSAHNLCGLQRVVLNYSRPFYNVIHGDAVLAQIPYFSNLDASKEKETVIYVCL